MIKKATVTNILIVLLLGCYVFASDEPFCEQVANYTMDVKLNTENRTISATELLTWTNTTDFPADELWFHLYWNGFQNNMSDFLQEGLERWEWIYRSNTKDDWGYIRIGSIQLIDEESGGEYDLTHTQEFRHPDNENFYDQTVMTVKVPQPVEPGQTISLRIDFSSKVPRPIHRTGVYQESYFIAQWFPKIGVFEDGQWNCHQFHATTNFYADYGTYDIKITVPTHYIIGATGEHREQIKNRDGTTTHRFVQHSVHDFAWTASPHYLEFKEDYMFSPGKTVSITLLLQPYHRNQKDRYMNAVKHSIRLCSQFYGDYPYTTVTCVDPAYNNRCGGMEYPTLFTGGTYFLTRDRIPRPERVTIHEFGHGYFYGLVGSNEFENAWLDEGFTSFLDSEVYYAAYEVPVYAKSYFGIPVTFKQVLIPIESSGISRHRRTSDMDIMQNFTWKFMTPNSYGANSYSKAELMLRTLKRFLGIELFAAMIKDYSTRYWFRHPKPQDFYDVVSEYAREDMSWFLDQFVYGSGRLDYAIGEIKNQQRRVPKGWINEQYSDHKSQKSEEPLFQSEVLVRRLGEVKIPVDVRVIFEDGSETIEKWDGQYRWKRFKYLGPQRVKRAIVDPDFKLVIDINRTNNSKTIKPNRLAPWKWVSNWMLWLQHAMEVFTIFGG
ncbi:MAG: M1 family metallopeptidase [Candidatus Aminicenantes bacterium]